MLVVGEESLMIQGSKLTGVSVVIPSWSTRSGVVDASEIPRPTTERMVLNPCKEWDNLTTYRLVQQYQHVYCVPGNNLVIIS